MRRFLPTILLLVTVLAAPPAQAYVYGPWGCNLRWDHCYGDAGVQNKNFACDTNSGSEVLVTSFVPAWDIGDMSGLEIVMNFAAASATVPLWWQFKNAGTCRLGSLTFNTTNALASEPLCPEWSQGFSAGGIGAYNIATSRGPNTMRVLVAIAVPPDHLQLLIGRHEYFAFNLVINHAKTVGTGVCAGCETPVCLMLSGVRMVTPNPIWDRYLTGPANQADSDYATWQGGGVPVVGQVSGCPAATPTQRKTWGAVKSLYR